MNSFPSTIAVRCLRLAPLAFATAAVFAASTASADEPAITPFSSAPVGEPPAAWKFATLPKKQPTRYSIVELDGARVLKVEAESSYGNLAHAVHVEPAGHLMLGWRWRVDQLVEGADLKTRDGDDSAAKLCVFFAFDGGKLSIGERTRLALARSTTGQEVPTETLCYVWDNKLPVDTVLPNAFTARIRFIVLESGSAKLGRWTSERRDVAADYLRAFANEAEGKVPAISGVAVSADADNTQGRGLSYFGDVTLAP